MFTYCVALAIDTDDLRVGVGEGRPEVRRSSLGSAYMTSSLQKSPPELAARGRGTQQEVQV